MRWKVVEKLKGEPLRIKVGIKKQPINTTRS
jgi:hypothetical protein